jgi:hypothetical protein
MSDTPPGCLVLLVRLSADMTADVPTAVHGDIPAAVAARKLADDLIEGLVGNAAEYPLDLAVLGYRADENGAPHLFSVLNGATAVQLVPLATVARLPVEARAEGEPRRWVSLPAGEGTPCAADALAKVHQLIAVWSTGRFRVRPPVVVHVTGTTGLDDAYFRVARSIGLLATAGGPARLMHYALESGADAIRVGDITGTPGAAPWNDLFDASAELPATADRPARRALAVNDWDIADPWSALFDLAWHEDTVLWAGSGGFSHERAMWAQKMGNSPEQWEDAYATDAPGGAAAVADGASSGIYCNIWADQLSKRFLTDRPDTRDVAALNKWVNGLRTEWRTAIKYASLNWSKQAKVDQVGAAATLLTLETGPADETGHRPWRANAVGDASLFWVRENRLVATFPVVAADQFGSAPLLVRSSPGQKTQVLSAAGTCRPGDRFVLATDAVAARLFKDVAGGTGVDWGRYEGLPQDAWRAELDSLRSANEMVNDDCTLVVLRVAGGTNDWRGASVEASGAALAAEVVPEGIAEVEPAQVELAEEVPLAEAIPMAEAVTESLPVETSPVNPGADAPDPPAADEPPAARDGLPEPTEHP